MSISGLFNAAQSALFASQAALNATSNNIANVNTPGYSRQEVVLETATPENIGSNFVGRGVSIADIARKFDQFIQDQLMGQQQNYGKSLALDQTWGQVEQAFNEANNMGLSTKLQDFFKAWQDVAANPESMPQRTVLLQNANSLILTAKQMERSTMDAIKQANNGIDGVVTNINSIAAKIASLNGSITQAEAGIGTAKANDLRDQRDNLMNQLSNLTDFSSYEDKNGSVTIVVGMRNLVYGANANTLSTSVNGDGNKDVFLDSIKITSSITKGQLGGFITASDDVSTNSLKSLRRLVAALTNEVNKIHSQGYGLDGSTSNDFFSNLSVSSVNRDNSGAAVTSADIIDRNALTYSEYEVRFTSPTTYDVYDTTKGVNVITGAAYVSGGNIQFDGLNVVISNSSGAPAAGNRFLISPIQNAISNMSVAITDTNKIAAAASGTALPGDNTNANALVQLANSVIANLNNATLNGYYNGIVVNVGIKSKAATDGLTFDKNILADVQNRRDAVSGVNLDEEATNMIRFQRSYEAGARMITVTDELLQTVLKL